MCLLNNRHKKRVVSCDTTQINTGDEGEIRTLDTLLRRILT
jgi:hypothetical protein